VFSCVTDHLGDLSQPKADSKITGTLRASGLARKSVECRLDVCDPTPDGRIGQSGAAL
jgi:hypothetical protein